jgi:ABC-2 type transport system ATP-binding protein
MSVIVAENLSRTFGPGRYAVRDAGFEIAEGAVFGFLGPNGAGKTTTVRLLNGILTPTSGKASVFGFDSVRSAGKIHEICGVLTETAGLYESLSGLDNLMFQGSLYGLSHGDARSRSNELLRRFDLTDADDKPVKKWSTGMKKKLALARALLLRPKALFLDEPTSGLDPESASLVNVMVARMAREEGVTVFLCTHQLKYAEEICTEYGLISRGSIIAAGSAVKLAEGMDASLRLCLRGKNLPADIGLEEDSSGVSRIVVRNDAESAALIRRAINGGAEIYEARLHRASLEELYFHYQKRFAEKTTDLDQMLPGGAR